MSRPVKLAMMPGSWEKTSTLELSVIGRILETLKQIAPGTSRVAMIYNPDNLAAINYRGPFESSALPLSVQPIIAPIHSIADIERAIEALAEQPNGGAFFPPDITTFALHDQVNAILARHRVPAIYTDRLYVTSGGLVPTTRIAPTYFAAPRPTSTVCCAGKNLAIYRFSSR